MARLNTHLSATPLAGRSSTVDSLYRDPTPHLRASSPARGSSYSVMSPTSSDKENAEPESRGTTPRPVHKGKRPMAPPEARLPTPTSAASSSDNGNKRRRTTEYSAAGSSIPCFEDDDAEMPGQGDETTQEDDDDEDMTKYYDPQQDPEVRRAVRTRIRNHYRNVEDHREELVKPENNGILDVIKKSDFDMGKVKNTTEAAMDSRLLVYASDLAGKRMDNSLNENSGIGIDVDQFVSKCIFFMRSGGHTAEQGGGSSTQARSRRQAAVDEDDEEDDTGDGLDWALLGREACFPCNKRPPVSSFLLGPLSVQKRARTTQPRRAKSQRQPTGPATRPQELTQADIKQSENTNLPHLVKGIKARLEEHINGGQEKIEAELSEIAGDVGEELGDDDVKAACRRQRLSQTPKAELCVSLFDFVINPKSFGQTVENMFYVSFLIREGNLEVLHDGDGLPVLIPSQPHSLKEQRDQNVQKHQAIFSMDWPTWKTLIEAFDIKEPLIPHRVSEETTVAAGGWYG